MPYNEKLADRLRKRLTGFTGNEEKKMMGGLVFMVNGKMCVGVFKDELMCRIDPGIYESVLHKKGCRPMEMKGWKMKSFVLIGEPGLSSKKDFEYWIGLSLQFNANAR